MQSRYDAALATELTCRNSKLTRTTFLVSRRILKNPGRFWPGVLCRSLLRWLGPALKLHDIDRSLTNRSPKAISTSITTADNHHPFTTGVYPLLIRDVITVQYPVLLGQIVHCEMDPAQVTTGHTQITMFERPNR